MVETKVAPSKWTLCNANLQNHNESQLATCICQTIHDDSCMYINQPRKNPSKTQQDSPLYIKYTFSSLMFWFVKKIKPESLMSKIHPISLLVLLPIPTPQLTQSMGLEPPPTHRQLHSTFSLLLWRFVTRTAASSTDVVCIDIYYI